MSLLYTGTGRSEVVRDLLNPKNDNLKIREMPSGEVTVADLSSALRTALSSPAMR